MAEGKGISKDRDSIHVHANYLEHNAEKERYVIIPSRNKVAIDQLKIRGSWQVTKQYAKKLAALYKVAFIQSFDRALAHSTC